MDVTMKRNIFKTNANKTDIILELPCKCSSLMKQSRKRILLLTDLKFQNPPKSFHLGDSDAIVPRRKKVLNMIRERFRNCDNYIVRNIHKIMFGDRIRKIISESKNKAKETLSKANSQFFASKEKRFLINLIYYVHTLTLNLIGQILNLYFDSKAIKLSWPLLE